jgi:O-antigen ligase
LQGHETSAPVAAEDLSRAIIVAIGAVALCFALALLEALATGSCAALPTLPIPAPCGSKLAPLIPVAIAAFPLVALLFPGRGFALAFGLYVVLVPVDAMLIPGSHTSLTKLIGILVVATAVWTMARRRQALRVPNAVFFWLAVVTLIALSTLWAIDVDASLHELPTIVSAFALFALVTMVPVDREDFRAIAVATIASGVVAGALAIAQRHELAGAAGLDRLAVRLGTATIDPNQFAAALLLPIAVTVTAIVRAGYRYWVLLVPALALMLAAVYLTASRGAALALVAMAIVAILASRRRLLWSGLLAIAVAGVVLIPNELASRIATSKLMAGSGRIDIWHVALSIFKEHWALGTGFANFPAAYDRAFFSAFEQHFESWHRASHSLIVSTTTELGIAGALVLGAALVAQYRSLGSIRVCARDIWERTTFRAAFVGLLVAALFLDVLTFKYSWLLFMEMLLAGRVVEE